MLTAASSASDKSNDQAELGAALAANFPDAGFVSKVPVRNSAGEPFLMLVLRDEADAESLSLEITDCLEAHFRRRLDLAALEELRRDAGMAAFEWKTFLRLLASALRGQNNCTVTADPQRTGPDETRCLQLDFRFSLQQGGSLGGRLSLEASASLPSKAASPEVGAFMRELRRFVVSALDAAGTGKALQASSQTLLSPGASPVFRTTSAPAQGSAPLVDRLSPRAASESVLAGMPSFGLGFAADATLPPLDKLEGPSSRGSTPRGPPTPSSAAPPPKKRVGGSLVDPHARKTRRAGVNPFLLS
eukprot:TRINITY_DN94752_c0_g1_i1.p1 TRINITY_DN94752_c0_g1~~TRINITY_DN94752_c0_g1_i1.p1  ORF type:complete len:312 (+),score=56.99 TRINITY_DN94752_c0_g1_i1:28-936(+)